VCIQESSNTKEIVMPDMNVADVIDELKRINPNYIVKIIVTDEDGERVIQPIKDIRIISGQVILK